MTIFVRYTRPQRAGLDRMQLALYVTRRTPHGVFCAWCKQCLPSRGKPVVQRLGIVGMRDPMVIPGTYDDGHV